MGCICRGFWTIICNTKCVVVLDNLPQVYEVVDYLKEVWNGKRKLLGEVPSVNTLMYEYYFSKPEDERVIIMKKSHDEVVSEMAKILVKVYKDKKLCRRMSEHICIVLQGLTNLSFSGCISKKIIEEEFTMLKTYLNSMYHIV